MRIKWELFRRFPGFCSDVNGMRKDKKKPNYDARKIKGHNADGQLSKVAKARQLFPLRLKTYFEMADKKPSSHPCMCILFIKPETNLGLSFLKTV